MWVGPKITRFGPLNNPYWAPPNTGYFWAPVGPLTAFFATSIVQGGPLHGLLIVFGSDGYNGAVRGAISRYSALQTLYPSLSRSDLREIGVVFGS